MYMKPNTQNIQRMKTDNKSTLNQLTVHQVPDYDKMRSQRR